MIERSRHLTHLQDLLRRSPVVAILGARQVGKTTLARQVIEGFSGRTTLFDLENPTHVARLDDAMLALSDLEGLVVVDEVHHRPELFRVLRVLVDRPGSPARFLVLGSASPGLLRQSSESLAGRIAYYELTGFAADEVGSGELDRLWLRGGFPRSFLADTEEGSAAWRRDFIRTFLERDIPQFGFDLPAATLRRFWAMLAHLHGHVWNASDLARSFGVSDMTVRRYLDILTSTFVVRLLPPWHENLRKRQVKSPKVYIADPGILHTLFNLTDFEDLQNHPKMGLSWESFAMETVLTRLGARRDEAYFWATHAGAEIDLVVIRGRRRLGFEFKRTVAPRKTRSMQIALSDLSLDRIDVVHAGDETFPLAENIRAVALSRVWESMEQL
jgi:predicted AAA+ superfamily ATPase